ncbi:MAG: hypothetical protein GX594_14415 [Pirellulaceae bacterium]|nr:hypothetical protein [Pirellulaceae bacterium]
MIHSQWTLECENPPRLTFGDYRSEQSAVAENDPEPEPELLRWRIRRRGYQLASRFLGRSGDLSDRRHGLFAAIASSTETPTSLALSKTPDMPLEVSHKPSKENADRQQATENRSPLSDRKRPDLVLE